MLFYSLSWRCSATTNWRRIDDELTRARMAKGKMNAGLTKERHSNIIDAVRLFAGHHDDAVCTLLCEYEYFCWRSYVWVSVHVGVWKLNLIFRFAKTHQPTQNFQAT